MPSRTSFWVANHHSISKEVCICLLWGGCLATAKEPQVQWSSPTQHSQQGWDNPVWLDSSQVTLQKLLENTPRVFTHGGCVMSQWPQTQVSIGVISACVSGVHEITKHMHFCDLDSWFGLTSPNLSSHPCFLAQMKPCDWVMDCVLWWGRGQSQRPP